MKRFLQKSYSWLATLLLAVAFAVSGNVAAQGIELPFAFTASSGGTVDGVGFYMWSANWVDSAELYGEGDASATWGTINLTSPAKNIVKVELTCRTNSWSGVGSAAAAAATVCETEDLGGSFTTNGAVAIWQGSAHKLTFSSTDDIDVYKMVVYLEEGEVVKECTVGVDHYADNCKPGKHETPFSRYITLYMQENAATTTWTGSDNCPAEVTLTNEAGQKLPISQFNYWQYSDQIGVVLEENITTPGVYTLHIPEGLVAFESGKFNKEINVVWTIVEPDTRPTKDVVFDFTDGTYTNDGTLSYTKDGVVFTLNENRYNATAQGFRIATDGWVSFAAPEKATIKSIQLLQESSYGVSPDFIANVGEVNVYDKTLYWSGDNASVTLTDHYGTCYFTKAIVTLAVEEPSYVEPVLKAEDVSAEVAYYIFTDARGGLTVDGDLLKGTKEVDKEVDPTDVAQQFAFVNWEGSLYLYSVAAEKFIGKANRGNFTEEPVDPIYFKNEGNGTVMLYFDNSFNFNLGGSNQVTIDTWSKKDAGNSFKIMVAEKFDQTALLEKLANGGGEVEPTTKWEGEIVVNKTSISSVADLEGLQITFVGAQQVEFNEYGMYMVVNEDGSEMYAIWAQYPEEGYNGTYTLEGNTVTLNNFSTVECDPIPAGTTVVYLSDFSAFLCNGEDVDGDVTYFEDYAIAYEGAPAPVPFELVFSNNMVVCENGKKVEANEAGVGADFYLVNEGLTAVGKTATLYKDGNAMSFVMTLVDGTAISFLGGSSLITEPGTYTLEVPAGTYVDVAGNPSVAYYGTWVVIQKDEPVKDKYSIRLLDTELYFTTTEVKDNNVTTYSISATPEYFYIEPSGNGYTIKSADTDKWVGYDVISSWDFSNDEKVWTIGSLEGEPTLIYKNNAYGYNANKGFGVDDRFEGAGVYTDKSGQYWVIEKFEEGGEVVDPVEPTEPELIASGVVKAYLCDYELGVTYDETHVAFEQYDNDTYVLKNFLGGDDLTFSLSNEAGGYWDMAFSSEKGYTDENDYFYLGQTIGTDKVTTEKFWADPWYSYVFRGDYNDDYYHEAYILYWNNEENVWGTILIDFLDEYEAPAEPTEWNGNILCSEASSIDDLLTFTLEFEDAMEVEAAGSDILGVVFEESGNPYAIALCNGVFDVFGGVTFDGSKAKVEFVKIADLNAELQASAKAAAARIGGFTQAPGEANVVFAGKSFKVDGQLVTDIIARSYTFDGSAPTGLESISTNVADVIFDLSGRRVVNTNGGLYIKNGRKVYMK